MDLSQGEIDGVWLRILKTPNFWETLGVLPNVDPFLVAKLEERSDLYFPTARARGAGNDVANQSAFWLQNNFGIEFPRVIVSNEKGPLAQALKYDYFIDDRAKNCLEVKQARPECKVFLNDACHNQSFDLTEQGIPRIRGFNEFAKVVLSGE
jgi:5'(3')-deoxyribonucleotidase